MKFLFKKFLKKKGQVSKGGAILDQVIAESAAPDNKCLLYKLANFKGGGDLIEAMQTGGQIAVENLIREQFGVFMYKGGKGQIINRAEYLRWKYKDNTEVTIPIEASLSSHDPLSKWVDHEACWQMQYRGSLGESLIHVLVICDTKMHTKLARILLRVFPEQAIDIMEGEEYLGASALHLAIAYSNNELVIDLVEAGANINQRAIGRFFLPKDQQSNKPKKNTDYEGLAYLGEYPLAWAACCSNESVYNLLLEHGADPDARDHFGNMILHMVVVCDKLDMFGYALRHPKYPCKNGIANYAGLTPLTLACMLGRAEVFKEMLELSAREFWRYSNITCSAYPLNALDTISPDGSTNWQSALFIILDGTKQEHLDMLDGGIIQKLLEEKWDTFAQRQFSKRLLILFVHLFFLSMSVSLRKPRSPHATENELAEEQETTWQDMSRYFCECVTILGVLSFVIFQQGDELKNQGLKAFLKSLKTAPPKAVFLISNLLILAVIPYRLMGDIDTEEALLIFAVPGSWFLLMFFAGAIRLTGPFVTMIFSMITGDMLTFSIIYFIVLFGFCNAFYFLYKGHPEVEETGYSTYMSTWMALFQMTLGDYDYSEFNELKYANMAKTVFIIFMIFVPILLLNMLIAMMGNTYAAVIEQSEKEFVKQWAKIVVSLERAVPKEDAKKYLETYSIPLTEDERGVMVIKSKSKTRARQRKGAVGNWKRVLKVTLGELKKKGMSGEELRRIMWGRASITSPTKISKKKKREMDMANEDPFGLTAALDQMSYTQDILMMEQEEVIIDPVKKQPIPKAVPTDVNAPKPGDNMVSLMGDLKDSQVPGTAPSTTPHTPKSGVSLSYSGGVELHGAHYNDPLRELIILTENKDADPNDESFWSRLLRLAEEATLLDHIEEVKESLRMSEAQKQEQKAAEVQAAVLFQNPKDIIDPVKEAEFMKTLQALVESDSDAEKPVLGKGSLIRRAKSAVSRRSSSKQRKTDEHPLFKIAWEEQVLSTGLFNYTYDDLKTPQDDTMMDVADQDYDEATVADEVLEPDPEPKSSDVQSESSSVKSKSRRRRGRFARNKVSPTSSDEGDGTGQRRVKTAPPRDSGQDPEDSPPDPLEPWSTRDLMNINQLLDQNDSPLVGDEPVPMPQDPEEEE